MKVYLNGKFVDKANVTVSVFDHGVLYGDGVFEGIRSYDGLIFKLEESPTELVWRMHAAAAQVDMRRLLDGVGHATGEREKLVDGWEVLRDLPIRISDQRGLDAVQRISRKHAEDGGELIIVDQLSMVSVQEAEVGYRTATLVSNTLRRLAQDLHLPILS